MAAEKVRYCDYPVYPPISWSDGKQVRGLAPERGESTCSASLGYEVEVVVLGNWKRCLLDAAEGRVDVVLAYSTAQREQSMLFSTVPVLREEVGAVHQSPAPGEVRAPGGPGPLPWRPVVRRKLRRGSSTAWSREHNNIEWVSDSRQNFGKLIRGRIDFITQERRTGQLYVENLPGAEDIVALPKALSVDYLRVAVSRRSPLAAQMPRDQCAVAAHGRRR